MQNCRANPSALHRKFLWPFFVNLGESYVAKDLFVQYMYCIEKRGSNVCAIVYSNLKDNLDCLIFDMTSLPDLPQVRRQRVRLPGKSVEFVPPQGFQAAPPLNKVLMLVAAVAIPPPLLAHRQQLRFAGAAASLVDRQRLGDRVSLGRGRPSGDEGRFRSGH